MKPKPKIEYSKNEAKERFEAALRGSRNVGPKPMKGMISKRKAGPSQTKKKPGC